MPSDLKPPRSFYERFCTSRELTGIAMALVTLGALNMTVVKEWTRRDVLIAWGVLCWLLIALWVWTVFQLWRSARMEWREYEQKHTPRRRLPP